MGKQRVILPCCRYAPAVYSHEQNVCVWQTCELWQNKIT